MTEPMRGPHRPGHDDVLGLDDAAGPDARALRRPSRTRRAILAVLTAGALALYGPDLLASSGAAGLLSSPPADPPRPAPLPAPPTTPSPPSPPGPRWQALHEAQVHWSPRGELASDPRLVADVRAVLGPADSAGLHLLWGGRVAGGRLALTARPVPEGVAVVGLHFPDGRPAQEAVPQRLPVPVTSGRPPLLGWVGPAGQDRRTLVVLGPPERTTVALSATVEHRSGKPPRRPWREVDLPDGVLVTALPEPVFGPVVVRRPRAAVPEAPLVLTTGYGVPAPTLAIDGLQEPDYAGPPPARVREVVSLGASALAGVRSASVLWSGAVAGTVRAAVVRLQVEGGGTWHTWVVGRDGPADRPADPPAAGPSAGAPAGEAFGGTPYPVPGPLASSAPALLQGRVPGTGQLRQAVVSPAGGTEVVVVRGSREVVRLPLDPAGVALVPPGRLVDASMRLAVRGARGQLLVEVPVGQLILAPLP